MDSASPLSLPFFSLPLKVWPNSIFNTQSNDGCFPIALNSKKNHFVSVYPRRISPFFVLSAFALTSPPRPLLYKLTTWHVFFCFFPSSIATLLKNYLGLKNPFHTHTKSPHPSMLSDRNELTFRVNMLFKPMGDSDKTFKHNNDWTPADNQHMPSTSASSMAHVPSSWLTPPSHFAFSNGPVTTSLPQQQPPTTATAQRFTPTTTALPSYQGWSGYDFHNNHLDPVQSHIMSAPTTPMTEDEPPMSYIQGHQHPYAVTPSYTTLTNRRDPARNDTLHHQSSEQYDYDRQQHAFQTWDYHHPHHTGGESPSSDHFYPPQDDFRKSTVAASGMPMLTTPPPVADYQYSPNLGDGTPSPISNSYPTSTDYLAYHEEEIPKHTRRYSIGGGMITAAPHNTNMPSYPPYMKAYHYKVPLTERPYKCDKCPQSFNRNHDLKRHKRIHLSVKPFPCQTCDKQFSRKDALKRHILVKRCGQPLPPDGRRSSNHQNVSRSTSGVSNNRNKSGALDLTDQYANATMAPPY